MYAGLAVEVRLPHLLGEPRVALLAERIVLPADAPAGVAALDDVNPALAIALIGVVVAGEEIAVFVEREFLRIAQPAGNDLHVGAVRLAAEDSAFIGEREHLAFLRRHMRAAIAEGEIKPAIRTEDQAVHVVAGEGEAHAIAEGERLALLRLAVLA